MPLTKCNTDQLHQLLSDQLPERLQSEIADHLTACEKCRQVLESIAGDAGWWSEVESCFRAYGNDTDSGTGSSLSGEPVDSDDSFAVDFVVDFLEPSDQPDLLGRLGEYEILDVIGRGGMGVVLKGFQRELGRFVAVKVMAPHLATSGAARQRFVREARAAAAIVHPHVMPIHSVCTAARLPYLVMPFVACESLQQRIDRQGALDVTEILRIGLQAAHGLAASHAQGLVHRDIKPANILLEKGVDRVMLTDFGLARAVDDASLTRTGIVTGTPQYMSPEQSCGESIDARSDLFSLGSVLYAMCAGRPPFRAETTLAVLRRIIDTQARSIREINPNIPEWLERIVACLHDKSPDRRFQSAAEVADLLEQCLAHVQQPTVMPVPEVLRRQVNLAQRSMMVAKWRSRSWTFQSVVSALAALLVTCMLVALSWSSTWFARLQSNLATVTEKQAPSGNDALRVPPLQTDVRSLPGIGASEASMEQSASEDDRTSWNGIAHEVELLWRNNDQFELKSRRIWDDVPILPSASVSSPNADDATKFQGTLQSERKANP